MAGNLKAFKFVDATGSAVRGDAITYGTGSSAPPVAYNDDPQEEITYASAHDNQNLWDIQQYKLPTGLSTADRVRALNVALDVVLLGQGVPFLHMADERLRSKSMDKDSYNSGDWFNRVDWTGADTGWKSGLPTAAKDQGNWATIRPIFANANIAPTQANVTAGSAHFEEMLKVRKSSRLFRLTTSADVLKRVDFLYAPPNDIPGLIVMTITDAVCGGDDLDPARDALVVLVNADKQAHTVTVPGASGFTLHAALAASADPVVKTASVSGADFTVPARTTAVFEQLQRATRGAGLPCNTR
jgi:pullulanase/glycogen debranching enzyme